MTDLVTVPATIRTPQLRRLLGAVVVAARQLEQQQKAAEHSWAMTQQREKESLKMLQQSIQARSQVAAEAQAIQSQLVEESSRLRGGQQAVESERQQTVEIQQAVDAERQRTIDVQAEIEKQLYLKQQEIAHEKAKIDAAAREVINEKIE